MLLRGTLRDAIKRRLPAVAKLSVYLRSGWISLMADWGEGGELHGGQSGKRPGAIPSASSHRHSPCGRRRTPAARPPTSGRLPLAQARMQRVGLASTFRLRRSCPIFSSLPILWGGVPHHSLPPSLLSWFVTPTQSSVVGPGFFLRSDPPGGGTPRSLTWDPRRFIVG